MKPARNLLQILLTSTLVGFLCTTSLAQTSFELDETCVVSILNRTVRVQPDGTWRITNVPANFSRIRVRATCVKDGVTLSGQSDLILFEPDINNGFSPFTLGGADPIPESLTLSATTTRLPT